MLDAKKIVRDLNKEEIRLISKSNFFILQDSLNFSHDKLLHCNYSQKLVTKSIFKYNFCTNFFSTQKIKFPCFLLYGDDQAFLKYYFSTLLFNSSLVTSLTIKFFDATFYKLDFLPKGFFDFFPSFFLFFFIMSFDRYNLIIHCTLLSRSSRSI
jgi:hypothetical protein